MKKILFATLISMIVLASAMNINAQTEPEYMSSVKVYLDGYFSNIDIRPLIDDLMLVQGIGKVVPDAKNGILMITPKPGEQFDFLFLLKEIQRVARVHVGSGKDLLYTFRKADVVAQGTLVEMPAEFTYSRAEALRHTHNIYKFQVGNTTFIMSSSGMSGDMSKAGYNQFRVEGTVTVLREGYPVLVVSNFEKAGPEEQSNLTKSATITEPTKPKKDILSTIGKKLEFPKKERSRIDSVRLYVAGINGCKDCGSYIQDALKKEKNIKDAIVDPDTGIIDIVPKPGKEFEVLNLSDIIGNFGPYVLIKTDVVATGIVKEVTIDYGKEKAKRYRLSAGEDTKFILSENDKLDELIKSKDKAVTVIGTITAFVDNKTPILEVSEFEKLEKIPAWLSSTSKTSKN